MRSGYSYECTPDYGCGYWYSKWVPEDIVTKIRKKDLTNRKK